MAVIMRAMIARMVMVVGCVSSMQSIVDVVCAMLVFV
jgi:hypothetical protein